MTIVRFAVLVVVGRLAELRRLDILRRERPRLVDLSVLLRCRRRGRRAVDGGQRESSG